MLTAPPVSLTSATASLHVRAGHVAQAAMSALPFCQQFKCARGPRISMYETVPLLAYWLELDCLLNQVFFVEEQLY